MTAERTITNHAGPAFSGASPLTHAYRVVNGLNGAVPSGEALLKELDILAVTAQINAGLESAPVRERGNNPTNAQMAAAVIGYVVSEQAGLPLDDLPAMADFGCGLVDLVDATAQAMPEVAGVLYPLVRDSDIVNAVPTDLKDIMLLALQDTIEFTRQAAERAFADFDSNGGPVT